MTDLDSYFLRFLWAYEDQQEEQELLAELESLNLSELSNDDNCNL